MLPLDASHCGDIYIPGRRASVSHACRVAKHHFENASPEVGLSPARLVKPAVVAVGGLWPAAKIVSRLIKHREFRCPWNAPYSPAYSRPCLPSLSLTLFLSFSLSLSLTCPPSAPPSRETWHLNPSLAVARHAHTLPKWTAAFNTRAWVTTLFWEWSRKRVPLSLSPGCSL